MVSIYENLAKKIESIIANINNFRAKKDYSKIIEEIYKLHLFSEDFFVNLELQATAKNEPIQKIKSEAKDFFDGLSTFECQITGENNCSCLDDLITYLKNWVKEN